MEVVPCKLAVLKAALDEQASSKCRSTKDTVAEFDLNKLGGVEQTPIPMSVDDAATAQNTFKCVALDIEVGERAVLKDVVRPPWW